MNTLDGHDTHIQTINDILDDHKDNRLTYTSALALMNEAYDRCTECNTESP